MRRAVDSAVAAIVGSSQLAEVCGSLPQDDEDRVYELPAAALEKLAKALLRFQSLDNLHAWLDRHAASDV